MKQVMRYGECVKSTEYPWSIKHFDKDGKKTCAPFRELPFSVEMLRVEYDSETNECKFLDRKHWHSVYGVLTEKEFDRHITIQINKKNGYSFFKWLGGVIMLAIISVLFF